MERDAINKINPIGVVDIGCRREIKTRFETLLSNKNMRQTDLAFELGCDKSYICRVVNGQQDPPLYIKLKIAKILACDTSLLWGDPVREKGGECYE